MSISTSSFTPGTLLVYAILVLLMELQMSHFHVVEAIQTRGSSMLRNAIRVDAPLGREKGSLPKWFSNDLPKANRQYMKDAFDAADDINSESVSTDDPKKPKNFPRFAKAKIKGADKAMGLKGAGDCFGLVNEQCVPCPAPEQNFAGHAGKCDLMKSQCDNLFCDPLCLRTIPVCRVEGVPPPFQEANTEATSKALCAVLRAHTCVTGGCCEKDDMLQDWTEQYTFGATYPESPMMIQACKHNRKNALSAAKLCGLCKAAMAGKIHAAATDKETICRQLESFTADWDKDPDATSGTEWTPYNEDFGFPGIPKHKSLKERCEKLYDALVGKIPGDAAAFAASNACHCMGCCDPIEACHFPIGNSV